LVDETLPRTRRKQHDGIASCEDPADCNLLTTWLRPVRLELSFPEHTLQDPLECVGWNSLGLCNHSPQRTDWANPQEVNRKQRTRYRGVEDAAAGWEPVGRSMKGLDRKPHVSLRPRTGRGGCRLALATALSLDRERLAACTQSHGVWSERGRSPHGC